MNKCGKAWLTIEEIAAESRKFLMKAGRPSPNTHPADIERSVWMLVQQRYQLQQLAWKIERRRKLK